MHRINVIISLLFLLTQLNGDNAYVRSLYDSTIDELETILVRTTDPEERVDVKCTLVFRYLWDDLLRAQNLAIEAIKEAQEIGYTFGEANAWGMQGILFRQQGLYEQSADSHLKQLKLANQLGDKQLIANTNSNIGLLYRDQERYAEAVEYFENSMKLKKEVGEPVAIRFSLSDLVSAYTLLGDYEKAFFYNRELIERCLEANHEAALADAYFGLGMIHYKKGDLDAAEQSLLHAKEYFSKSRNYYIENQTYQLLCEIYREIGQIEKSIDYGQLAYDLASNRANKKNLRDAAKSLAASYRSAGKHEEAYHHLSEYVTIREEINKLESESRIALMVNKYERKRAEFIQEQQHQMQIDHFRRLTILGSIIAGIVFVISIVYVFATRYNKKAYHNLLDAKNQIAEQRSKISKQRREIKIQLRKFKQLNMTKNRILAVITHEINDPIKGLTHAIKQIENSGLSESQKTVRLKSLVKGIISISETSDQLLTWVSAQRNGLVTAPQTINMCSVVNQSILPFTSLAESKHIVLTNLIPASSLVFVDKDQILLVMRNLLSNAIRFTDEGGKVSITIHPESENRYRITVEDNGVGMSQTKLTSLFDDKSMLTENEARENTGSDLGLILCKELIELNDGRIWIESSEGVGTMVHFSIPSVQ